jgi:hypothetical protein
MNKKNMLNIVCLLATVYQAQGSWFGFGSKKSAITENDRYLLHAITNDDYKAATLAMKAGVNPNAKIDGETTLFVEAFEHALRRDENDKITDIDQGASDIARHLAFQGGDIKELQRDLPAYLDAQGNPKIHKFENAHVAQQFKTFVEHLTNLAAQAKRK